MQVQSPLGSQEWRSQLCPLAQELTFHQLAFTGLSPVFGRLCRVWIVGIPVCKFAGSPILQSEVCH